MSNFDWVGYVVAILRNVVSICAFIGGICAWMYGDVAIGIAFIFLYAIVATDEQWFMEPEDEEEDKDDKSNS